MAASYHRVKPGDEHIFDHIAPEVFDESIHVGRLNAYLSSPGHMMIVAMENGVVVGQVAAVLHAHPDKPTELYIDEVGTAVTHRRQGIAKGMLAAMFAWGREVGCEDAWLGTELDNDAAKAFYRGHAPLEDQAIQFYLFKL